MYFIAWMTKICHSPFITFSANFPKAMDEGVGAEKRQARVITASDAREL